jgi:hypothetical protein
MTKYYPFTRMHILLVLIISALVACKKDHDNSDPNKTYVLSKVHSDGRVMATFEYNDQHQLIKKTYSTKVTRTSYATDESRFYYGTDARLSRVEWTSTTVTTGTKKYSDEYEYNQGRLITKKHYDNSHNLIATYEYSYTANTITQTKWVNGTITYVDVFTVNDKGNIVKLEHDDVGPDNNDRTEEWLDYDDKKKVSAPSAGDVGSKNNPRQYIITLRNASPNVYVYEYKYNRAGYVTETKMGHVGETLGAGSTYEYIAVN